MRAFLIPLMIFAGQAHAQGTIGTRMVYAAPYDFVKASATTVESVQTVTMGHVTPQEIRDNEVKVEGVTYSNSTLVFDTTNPQLDATSVILNSGRQVEVVRAIGGDMGGGGSRIIDVTQSIDIQIRR